MCLQTPRHLTIAAWLSGTLLHTQNLANIVAQDKRIYAFCHVYMRAPPSGKLPVVLERLVGSLLWGNLSRMTTLQLLTHMHAHQMQIPSHWLLLHDASHSAEVCIVAAACLHHNVLQSEGNEAQQSAELHCSLLGEACHGRYHSLHASRLCHPKLVCLQHEPHRVQCYRCYGRYQVYKCNGC